MEIHPLQFLVGSGCSGKTYVLMDIASKIINRDVFLFETKDRLTDVAFDALCKRKNCVILVDSAALSTTQIKHFISTTKTMRYNKVNVIIATDKHNREIRDILSLYKMSVSDNTIDIPLIPIKNTFSSTEASQLSILLTAVTAGIYTPQKSLLDNIISISENLAQKSKYQRCVPCFQSVPEIAALIALATEHKIYSTRAISLDLYDQLALQCKKTYPLIDCESTWSFETCPSDNSPVKYVLNANYWLNTQLQSLAADEKNHQKIVDAYLYIVSKIILNEGAPNLVHKMREPSYKSYIRFDKINHIFFGAGHSGQYGLSLIRKIYIGLNDLLSADPNYMHQRAKCYIRSTYFENSIEQKKSYFDKAHRDVNVALQIFTERNKKTPNQKLEISIAHCKYTQALIQCHKCAIDTYADIQENTCAIDMLHEALTSPFNSYAFAKTDTYNYDNVISKIITESIVHRNIVSKECSPYIEDLFRIISDNNHPF